MQLVKSIISRPLLSYIIALGAFPFYILFNNFCYLIVSVAGGISPSFWFVGNWCNPEAGILSGKAIAGFSIYFLLRFLFLEAAYRLSKKYQGFSLLRPLGFSVYIYDLLSCLMFFISFDAFRYFFSNAFPLLVSGKLGLPIYFCNALFGLLCLWRFREFKICRPLVITSILLGSFFLFYWMFETFLFR
jgi:hypothetical protein